MTVIVVGNEKNFAALRPRLFTGSVSSKTAGEVSAAIQEANPHADLKKLAPGTVLTIPDDLPRVSVRGDVSLDDPSKHAVAGIVTVGSETLTQINEAAQSSAGDAAAARKQLAKTLAGKQLGDAASADPAIAASLKAAQDAVAAADADAQARADALAAAQTEWGAELTALKATLPS
jgi:hypothetical protein